MITIKPAVIRVQLDLPESKVRDLEKIMSKTGVSTRKDLFENALTFFEWAVNQREMGRLIASIDTEINGFHEVLMPALASVKKTYEPSKNTLQKAKN